MLEETEALLERLARQIVYGTVGNFYVTRLVAQSRAVTFRAGLVVKIFRQFLSHQHRIRFLVTPLQIGYHPFKRVGTRHDLAALGGVLKVDAIFAAAVEHHCLSLFR